ncbi:MAG: hypothetical protein F4Z18_10830 [Caldilineaceae bacterium SB0666_bin_21]|nr:hypothetical protein [Caldilineaceae bacterium SB0666_bin_21]
MAVRLLIPTAALLAAWSYLSVWVPHPVAGLKVLGVDLLTFCKLFTGAQIPWPWQNPTFFVLPLAMTSLTLSQLGWFADAPGHWHRAVVWNVRLALWIASLYVALQILPLDWKPSNLFWTSNLLQTAGFAFCTGFALLAPLTSPLMTGLARWWIPPAALAAATAHAAFLVAYLPEFARLYRQPLQPGPGFYGTALGLAVLIIASIASRPRPVDHLEWRKQR